MQRLPFLIVSLLIAFTTIRARAVEIELVSKRFTNSPTALGETVGIELSADGNWAAVTVSDDDPDTLQFSSDVFLRNLATGEDLLVSRTLAGQRGNADSVAYGISAGGRFVLFQSDASDLVTGDDNDSADVFLFDRSSGEVSLVSRGLSGFANGDSTPLVMTPDGRFVVFESKADNVVTNDFNGTPDIFLFDRETGSIKLPKWRVYGFHYSGPVHRSRITPAQHLSAGRPDGSLYVIYHAPSEIAAAPVHNIKEFALTPDGHRMVAVANYADLFGGGSVLEIYDNIAATNGLISVSTNTTRPRGLFANLRISADGTTVFFTSNSQDLPGGDGSVMKLYSHDLVNGTTRLLTASGQTAKDDLFDLSIDSDGSELAFVSSGRNIEGTGESSAGYILRSAVSPNAVKVVVTKTDTTRATGNADSSIDPILVEPAISARALSLDGRIVVFTSDASDIIPGDTNGTADIFVRNLQTKETRLINLAPDGGGIIPGSRFIGMSVDGARVAWFAPNPDLAFRGTIYIYDTLSASVLRPQSYRMERSQIPQRSQQI